MVDLSRMHLDPNELLGYFDGTLDERRVREHLAACQFCRASLREFFLIKVLLSPPSGDLSGNHVPPETIAEYLGDLLGMEQNRAVEDHLAGCLRCLADYLTLKQADGEEHGEAPAPALVREVLENLESYRSRRPLGELFVREFRRAVNLAFRPAPDPGEKVQYEEDVAARLFRFRREYEPFMDRGLDRISAAAEEPAMPCIDRLEKAPPSDYAAGELLERRRPEEPASKMIPTGDSTVRLVVTRHEDVTRLRVEVRDRDDARPLPDVKVDLEPESGPPVSVQTDQGGTAMVDLPAGPSTLRIHLDRTYEIDLKSHL